jgi:hypothetical protein
MSKKATKWKKHVDVVETPAPQYVVTPTTWQIHRSDQSPAEPGVTQVRVTEIDGIRTVHIDQFGETISLTEDEFEMVVQAGAQAFLQRWPK